MTLTFHLDGELNFIIAHHYINEKRTPGFSGWFRQCLSLKGLDL